MLKIKNGFLLTLLSCFLLFSCNFNLSKTNKSKTIPLSIQLPAGAKPSILIEDNGRYALPTVSDKIWYKAVLLDSSNKELSAANTQTSTVNISMPSGVGTCKVKVSGYLGNIGDESKIILEGITEEFTKETKELSVEVKPLKTGTGSVNLKIDIADGVGIQTCRINSSKFSEESLTKNNNTFVFSKNSISSGFYDVSFSFYSDTECKNLVYWFPETINIFDNLETNTWLLGQSNPINGGSGTIKITQDLLNNFKKTDITDFYVGTNSNDNQDGDFFNPFDTIQKAVNHIFDINDGSSEYTIYLKNDVKHEEDGFQVDIYNVEDISNPVNIKITSYGTGKKYKIFSDDDNGSKSLVNVVGYASLTLSNLILENNNSPSVGCTFIFSEGGTFNFNNVDFQTISDDPLQNDGAITVYDYYVNGVLKKTAGITINECSFFNGDYSSYSNIAYRSFGDITFSGSNSIIKIFTNSPITLGKDFSISNNVLVALSEHEDSGLLWYQDGKIVLKKGMNGPNISDVYTKFELDSSDYEIGSDGKLKKKAAEIELKDATEFSTANVYTISTPEELVLLSDWVNGTNGKTANNMAGITFEVTKPLNMEKTNGFTPIGSSSSTSFNGIFNGNNYLISNLTISKTASSNVGLFGYASGTSSNNLCAQFKNIRLEGEISGKGSVGGLVGYYKYYNSNETATIADNCIVKVKIVSSDTTGTDFGGIFGVVDGKNVRINNCIFTGSINAPNYVGGIVGDFKGSGTGAEKVISNCINLGSLTYTNASENCGGIITNADSTTKISDSYSLTNITFIKDGTVTTSKAYGLVKYLTSGASGGSISNCYWIADSDSVLGSPTGTGFTITNCSRYSNSQTDLNNLKTKFSWATTTVKYNGLDYPVFTDIPTQLMPDSNIIGGYNITSSVADLTASSSLPAGNGAVYSISTPAEFKQLSTWVKQTQSGSSSGLHLDNNTFVIANDIDMTGVTDYEVGVFGNVTDFYFSGTFDGNNKTISGINLTDTTNDYVGLFVHVKNGTVKNLRTQGMVSGKQYAGGIVGYLNTSTIYNCISEVNVSSSSAYAGGLVGYTYGSSTSPGYIINSCNFGSVSGNDYCSGICSYSSSYVRIYNVYNAGDISAIGSNKYEISYFSGSYYLLKNYFHANSGLAVSNKSESSSYLSSDTSNSLNSWIDTNKDTSPFSDYNLLKWDYTYTFNGVAYPLFINLSSSSSSADHRTLSSEYVEVSSYSAGTIPSSGAKLKVTSSSDIAKINDWVYASSNASSLEGVEFVLTEDIDYEGKSLISPVNANDSTTGFKGTFDGNGYAIKNVVFDVKSTGLHGAGLISVAGEGAVIKNVKLENVTFGSTSSTRLGGIVGHVTGTDVLIENCEVNLQIEKNNGRLGGLIGSVYSNASVTIRNCITNGTISGPTYIGGLVGGEATNGRVIIENSVSYCDLVHSSGYTGGLVSCTQSTKAKIKNSFFGGTITRPTGDSSKYNPIAYKIANSADGTAVSFVNIFYDESSVSGSMSNELPSDISFQSVSTSSSKYYIGGDSSQDLLETLNAWVTTQNESSPGTYKLWKYDSNGKLVFQ